MLSRICVENDYLRAELSGRETAAETRAFLLALAAAADSSDCRRALIKVSASKPLFTVEKFRISRFFDLMSHWQGSRVALLGDTEELRGAHEYIEVLAQQHGVDVRSFKTEHEALAWLRHA